MAAPVSFDLDFTLNDEPIDFILNAELKSEEEFRIFEDDDFRILEDEDFRLLE